jgi:hypothetical protein
VNGTSTLWSRVGTALLVLSIPMPKISGHNCSGIPCRLLAERAFFVDEFYQKQALKAPFK